eukprot:508964-Amphidinium_carterae.2
MLWQHRKSIVRQFKMASSSQTLARVTLVSDDDAAEDVKVNKSLDMEKECSGDDCDPETTTPSNSEEEMVWECNGDDCDPANTTTPLPEDEVHML